MDIQPVYYGIAVFIMLVALFSLRYEIAFLKSKRVTPLMWFVSILNFLTVISLLVVLLGHHKMSNLLVLKLILTFLIMLLIISTVQLLLRRRLFVELARELAEHKRSMIYDMRDIIDEKKREKIRKKYGDDEPRDTVDPITNGKPKIKKEP
jgi:hypothetical protein